MLNETQDIVKVTYNPEQIQAIFQRASHDGLKSLTLDDINKVEGFFKSYRATLEQQIVSKKVDSLARSVFKEISDSEQVTADRLTELFAEHSKRERDEFKGDAKKLPYVRLVKTFREAGGTVYRGDTEVRLGLVSVYQSTERAFGTMLPVKGKKNLQKCWTPPALEFVDAQPT